MEPIEHNRRQETETAARALTRARARALSRKRRLKESLQHVVRLANAIDSELDRTMKPVPEIALDHLSTALVSLDTCFRRLTRSPKGLA